MNLSIQSFLIFRDGLKHLELPCVSPDVWRDHRRPRKITAPASTTSLERSRCFRMGPDLADRSDSFGNNKWCRWNAWNMVVNWCAINLGSVGSLFLTFVPQFVEPQYLTTRLCNSCELQLHYWKSRGWGNCWRSWRCFPNVQSLGAETGRWEALKLRTGNEHVMICNLWADFILHVIHTLYIYIYINTYNIIWHTYIYIYIYII